MTVWCNMITLFGQEVNAAVLPRGRVCRMEPAVVSSLSTPSQSPQNAARCAVLTEVYGTRSRVPYRPLDTIMVLKLSEKAKILANVNRLSHHLKVLKQVELVECRNEGQFDASDNKVLPLRPHRDYGSTSRPSVIRPPPVRFQERPCAQALYPT